MKQIILKSTAAAILLIGLLLGGCTLDERLYGTLTPDQIKTEDDMENLLKGAYSEFNDGSAFKMWGAMMTLLCADDLYATKGQFESYGRKNYNGANTEQMWNTMYRCIRNASYVIKIADQAELSPEYQKRAVGDASFIRAFAYYYLVRLYGGVPLRTEAVDIHSDLFLPRSSVEEVYDQIFKDLSVANYCLPLANEIDSDDLGRASKGAAQAIMASARLTYGNWLENQGKEGFERQYELAATWADSILLNQVPSVYSLLDDYADLWDVSKEREAYKEVIFGIRFSRDATLSQLSSNGSELAYRFCPDNLYRVTGNAAANANVPPGNGENNIRIHPYFFNYYFTNPQYSEASQDDATKMDYRMETSFLCRWTNEANGKSIIACPFIVTDPDAQTNIATKTGNKLQPYIMKYVDGQGKDNRNHENDFFIIRLAEIYLIKAEALNELYGPGNREAIEAFNAVRSRARKAGGTGERDYPKLISSGDFPTKTDFRMAILDERGLELVAEGVRWFDLVRMKHPTIQGKTMHDYRFTELANSAVYSRTMPAFDTATNTWSNPNAVSWNYVSTICDNISGSNKFLLFPIPLSELDNNPYINAADQNPGW